MDRDSNQPDAEVAADSEKTLTSETRALDYEEKGTEQYSTPSPHHLEGAPYTWLQRLRLFRQPWLSLKTMFTMMYRPILLLRFPVVVWSGFIYGAALVWFNVLNATSSMIFTGTYDFSASMVGLAYFGPTIGAILAWIWSGWVADKFSILYARRNKGIREPEERLWLLTMNTIVLPAGLILWGVGAAHHVHWFGLVVGFMLIAFTSATGGAFAINYALDSYKDLGGEVMVTVMIIRVSSTEVFVQQHQYPRLTAPSEHTVLRHRIWHHAVADHGLPEHFCHRCHGGYGHLCFFPACCQVWESLESPLTQGVLGLCRD